MTERMDRPLTFFKVIKEVGAYYLPVFKNIFWLVILASLFEAVVSGFSFYNRTIDLVLSLLALIVALFFYAWIIEQADSVIMNRPDTFKDSLHVAKRRFIHLLGVVALYIILVFILGVFVFGMQLLGKMLGVEILFALIGVLVWIYIFILLSFTVPAVVLDKLPILKSFEYSFKLVWGHWWYTLVYLQFMLFPSFFYPSPVYCCLHEVSFG